MIYYKHGYNTTATLGIKKTTELFLALTNACGSQKKGHKLRV
jgi:hypothetical protein